MMRLEGIAKPVAAALKLADASKQRAACLIACEMALQIASITDAEVLAAMDELKRAGSLSASTLTELDKLVLLLDEKYFDLQDNAEDGNAQVEALQFFNKARAVSALYFAGGKDAFVSAMEAIYEASAVTDDASNIHNAALLALQS